MAHDRITDWLLERYLLEELSLSERERIDQAIQLDETLAERIEAMKRSNNEILTAYPASEIASVIEQRISRQETRETDRKWINPLSLGLKLLPVMAAAWLAVIWLSPPPPIPSVPPISQELDRTITKGPEQRTDTPRLFLYQKVSTLKVEEILPNTRLSAGTLMQIAFSPGSLPYGIIFSVDGSGLVTLHFPDREGAENILPATGKQILLPNAYELDDAPGYETFVLITHHLPFDAATWLESVRSQVTEGKPLELSLFSKAGFLYDSITIKK